MILIATGEHCGPGSSFSQIDIFWTLCKYSIYMCKNLRDHYKLKNQDSTLQFTSVAQSCPTLSDPMDCSTPGLPVHHHLPELAQTHVRRVGDAIQPSNPVLSPSPPALNLSQHQALFQ